MSYNISADVHVLHKMILKVRCDPRFADPWITYLSVPSKI